MKGILNWVGNGNAGSEKERKATLKLSQSRRGRQTQFSFYCRKFVGLSNYEKSKETKFCLIHAVKTQFKYLKISFVDTNKQTQENKSVTFIWQAYGNKLHSWLNIALMDSFLTFFNLFDTLVASITLN